MHPRKQNLPPWDRRVAHPRHPTGRARRRWPRAYDGGAPLEEQVGRRYQAPAGEDQRRRKRPLGLDTLRQSPVRNGLVGLAVVGAAVPVAVNRYQQALRTDASHERIITAAMTPTPASETNLSRAWNAMEGERSSAATAREQAIEANLKKYESFPLTRELAEDIYDIAQEAGVDPEIAFGLVRAESSFKNVATSRVGAVGLTQLMPRTAAWLVPGTTTSDLRNPETNLRIGFGYLKDLIEKYDGDENLALTAYNRGPGTVDKVLRRGGNPDNGYASFVRSGDVGAHKG